MRQYKTTKWRAPRCAAVLLWVASAALASPGLPLQGSSELHADRDGDGITDYKDRCPATTNGATVDEFGCADSDKDGVIELVDRCRGTPSGAVVDVWGCADSDNDGVANTLDRCPATRTRERALGNGCAVRQMARLQAVYFPSGSAVLSGQAHAVIGNIAKTMAGSHGFYVEIQGHSDGLGAVEDNLQLSRQRAEAVRDALLSAGLQPNLVRLSYFGEGSPVADNISEQGRGKNRRVSFMVRRQ